MIQFSSSSHKGIILYNLIALKSQRVPFELPFICVPRMSSPEHQYSSVFPLFLDSE